MRVLRRPRYAAQNTRHAAAKLLAQMCRLQSANGDVSSAQQLAATLADFSVADKLLPLLTQTAEPAMRGFALVSARAALCTGFSQVSALAGGTKAYTGWSHPDAMRCERRRGLQ